MDTHEFWKAFPDQADSMYHAIADLGTHLLNQEKASPETTALKIVFAQLLKTWKMFESVRAIVTPDEYTEETMDRLIDAVEEMRERLEAAGPDDPSKPIVPPNWTKDFR